MSGTDDRTIKVWDTKKLQCVKTINHDNTSCSGLLKWDSSQILSGCEGKVYKWDISNETILNYK